MPVSDPIRAKGSGPSNPVRGFGVYGGIVTMDGVATQSIGTTPVKINQWTANLPSSEMSPEFNVDRITINKSGIYLVLLQMSFISSGGPAVWTGALRVNGVEAGNLFWARRVGGAGGVGSASSMVPVALINGDRLTVWVENDTGAFNFGAVQTQLVALLIG